MGFRSSLLVLVLPLFLFISLTFLFSFSNGESSYQHLENSPVPGCTEDGEWNTGTRIVTSELPLKCKKDGLNQPKRRLAEEVNSDNSGYMILAAQTTHRKDPSDNFNYYTGGWNISNPHYISSLGYAAAPPVVAAVIWFLLFGLWLCCCSCCCPRKDRRHSYSRIIFALSLCFLFLLTAAAVVGTVVLYSGQTKFQNSVVSVTSYVLKQADTVVVNLKKLYDTLMEAKKIGEGDLSLPKESQADIDRMGTAINGVADKISNVTSKSSTAIKNFLDRVSTYLTYAAAAMIVLAILGFFFSILGLQWLLYILMVVGWFLVAGTLIVSGAFLLVHSSVIDTCIAMDEWLQNPNVNSALEELFPKVDNQTAQHISVTTKNTTLGIISTLNDVITNVANAENIPPEVGLPLYYNQSGPLIPFLCSPFESNLVDRQCTTDEVDLKNAGEVWKKYVCEVKSGICITAGRLSPELYTRMMASVNVSNGLYKESPFLLDLIDSTFTKETFAKINNKHCPDLSKYSEMTYNGFVVSSAAVMLSIIFWIVYSRQRNSRAHSKKSLNMMNMPAGGRLDRDYMT